jgi:hypothetical protein
MEFLSQLLNQKKITDCHSLAQYASQKLDLDQAI